MVEKSKSHILVKMLNHEPQEDHVIVQETDLFSQEGELEEHLDKLEPLPCWR